MNRSIILAAAVLALTATAAAAQPKKDIERWRNDGASR